MIFEKSFDRGSNFFFLFFSVGDTIMFDSTKQVQAFRDNSPRYITPDLKSSRDNIPPVEPSRRCSPLSPGVVKLIFVPIIPRTFSRSIGHKSPLPYQTQRSQRQVRCIFPFSVSISF
jgi:hypothetical protein